VAKAATLNDPGLLSAVVVFALAAAASGILTGIVRRYALARAVIDVPNERSAHTRPVPRGGGLAIAGVVITGSVILGVREELPSNFLAALIGGGLIVAGIGWLDDHRSVSSLVRVVAHFLAAALAVALMQGLPEMTVGGRVVQLGVLGSLFAVLTIVWLINLYNFMDGIDGIAGVNAVTVGLFGAFLLQRSGSSGLASIAFLIAGASFGFLLWNWAPARIFLGDVGSGFLGFCFAVLAVASENTSEVPLLLWILLMGVFIVDATVTLIRRVARGENWYAAHNNHAYQRAVRSGFAHSTVSLAVAAINCLLGVAVIMVQRSPMLLVVAVAGLGFLVSIYLAVERRNPMGRAPRAAGKPLD
jgi:Fuc2NAc and GlcNAc transferase